MKKHIIALSGILLSLTANAVVINEETFSSYGGDLNNIPESIKYANNELREKSYSKEFLSVGNISGCTATWLGSDDSGWTYILTAAHCLPYKDEVTPVFNTFRSWDGSTIAQGNGYAYVPKERINRPDGFGGASTDIAILKLPTHDVLKDRDGNLVERPIINDDFNELNKKVMFVGYGTWGVGLNQSGSYFPETGERRLYGESVISGIWEMEHGMGAHYEPTGNTKKWAKVAPGDSGSAWWQDIKGYKVIIATTNGNSTYGSTAARASKYAPWIKGVYNNARLLSDEFLIWGNDDRKGVVGDIYKYNNPYNHDIEYFRLLKLGNDNRYWYFPTDKTDNYYWEFIGPYAWGSNDRKGTIGSFYEYNNPYNGDRELFKLINLGSDNRYWYFPTDKSNNHYWEYVKDIN